MFTTICLRILGCGINFQMDCLKTRKDQDFTNEYLEKGKETRHFESAQDREYWDNLALLCATPWQDYHTVSLLLQFHFL